jgi:hypothetical protein
MPKGKGPLGKCRSRWEDNIKMFLAVIIWDDMDWSDLAQDRNQWRAFLNSVMNFGFLRNPDNFLSS